MVMRQRRDGLWPRRGWTEHPYDDTIRAAIVARPCLYRLSAPGREPAINDPERHSCRPGITRTEAYNPNNAHSTQGAFMPPMKVYISFLLIRLCLLATKKTDPVDRRHVSPLPEQHDPENAGKGSRGGIPTV